MFHTRMFAHVHLDPVFEHMPAVRRDISDSEYLMKYQKRNKNAKFD